MEADSSCALLNPKRLKTLASCIKYAEGNLLHKFVLDNSPPNPSCCERDLNAHLLTLSGTALDVNELNRDGYSPLHLAVLHNNPLMVKKLLSCLTNIDVNLRCNNDRTQTILHSTNFNILSRLFSQRNRNGKTALYLAAKLGYVSIALELLKKGADINVRSEMEWTPLHAAALSGHLATLEFLVSQGADLYAEDFCAKTALFYAAQSGHLAAMEFLASSGPDPHAARQSLKVAALHGCPDVLQFFLGRVPDVDMSSLLLCAAESGSAETVQILINNGADVNTRDEVGSTPLHRAMRGPTYFSVFEFLVRRGADLKAQDTGGKTPLHLAIFLEKLQCAEWLIGKGADINARNESGETPLHSAIIWSELKSVDLFIVNLTDIDVKDEENFPYHLVVRNKLQCTEWLIGKGADINARDEKGKTPLHHAVHHNNLQSVEWLISKGADINARDEKGRTPLHYAASNWSIEMTKCLIQGGSDVNASDIHTLPFIFF